MKYFKFLSSRIFYTFILLLMVSSHLLFADDSLPLNNIQLQPGFQIKIYAQNVPDARSLALGNQEILFVGSRHAGKIYAILDNNRDHTADEVLVIANNLKQPNGITFHQGSLYVAETNRILKYPNIENQLKNPPAPQVIYNSLPKQGQHSWRYLAIGPDNKLYVSIGAPCNVCKEKDPRFATIARMNLDGSGFEIFAHGIRNSMGFDWHPITRQLWFTDNGRDGLGDNSPPDELNTAARSGLDFGFPFCHGADIVDPKFGNRESCTQSVPPVRELDPHVAALGMRFYTGKMFPADYRNQIFIAEHGSWDRSQPIGYRITLVKLFKNNAISYQPFAQGWLQGSQSWGRPVDVMVAKDGSLFISDDQANAIYRISLKNR